METVGASFCSRYNLLHHYVEQIPIEQKRKLTQLNNVPQYDENSFLIRHGVTLGEYNLLNFIIYSGKRKEYQQKSVQKH
jgi:hypothetical protein